MMLTVTPTISTTGLACGTTISSPTVTSAALFGSVVAGQRVIGAGIPFNTTVLSKETSSSITLDKNATATASPTLQFGYFASAIYAAGDALGFPFVMPGITTIKQVIVVDAAKIITAVKLLFFSTSFTETADNAAFAISDADALKICGYLSLTTSEVFANNQLVTGAGTILPFPIPRLATCQLICVGTPTATAVDNFQVNFIGE